MDGTHSVYNRVTYKPSSEPIMGQESELDLCVIQLPADDPAGTRLAGLACRYRRYNQPDDRQWRQAGASDFGAGEPDSGSAMVSPGKQIVVGVGGFTSFRDFAAASRIIQLNHLLRVPDIS
jgi:hypothetical protein